ncbi:unnamed protein product [Urochloa humidicola]
MVSLRALRRATAAAEPRPPRVGLLYDERMCAHATPYGEEHPENPERLRAIWRKLNAGRITSRCVVLKAKEAEDRYIASVHSQDRIKLMKEISSKKYNSSRNEIAKNYDSIYFNKGSSESAALAAGSVIEVAENVAAGELSSAIALVRPPGHHAEHDKAMGFCLFNNVAVAANYLLKERPDLGIKKILIVDWDVHHGNATQKMFYDDPRVLVFSVHRFDFGEFYPYEADASYCFIGEDAGKGYNINVPWEQEKVGDADYIAAWDHILLPVTEAFGPDIILVSAGFDAALGDPLGGCCITPNGYAQLLTKLLGFAQGRIVMALEGGYNLRSTANSIFACAKVLLGDKFTFNSSGKQPFESTWRIILAVLNELKTCWPVFSDKLQEIESWIGPSPSEVHSTTSACPIPEETKAGCNQGGDTSVPGTLVCSPTCFNQCNRNTVTNRRRSKRTMEAIYKQLTPEAHADPENEELAEVEAAVTQVFRAGCKRVCNASVPGTLERPPTCFNKCNPNALTYRRQRRQSQRSTKAIHRQMAPDVDVHAEAEDEELAAVEATAPQGFMDVDFSSDSSDPNYTPARVAHDAKAECLRTVESRHTTATSLDTSKADGGPSDIQWNSAELMLLRKVKLGLEASSAGHEEHMRESRSKMDLEELILKVEGDITRVPGVEEDRG